MDTRRRLVAVLVWMAVLILWFGFLRHSAVPMLLTIASLAILCFVTISFIDRIRVIERCGAHCPGCGFDLRESRGNAACPECGRAIDDETNRRIDQVRTGAIHAPVRNLKGRIALILLLSLALLSFAVLGLTVFLGAPPPPPSSAGGAGPPAAPPSAASTPASPDAGEHGGSPSERDG